MKRILSLDVLRGLTVACMILVNNGYGESFAQLQHSAWNGLTVCDMVFPFFLFIMGVSVNFSHKTAVGEILRRSVLILLIGWAIHYLVYAMQGDFMPWGHFRFTGVLTRIAVCYLAAALLNKYVPVKSFPWISGGLLVVYAFLLVFCRGYDADPSNILSLVDRTLLGEAHLYRKSPIDPEGCLSTVPAIAHTMLGCICGKMLKVDSPLPDRVKKMLSYGFILAAAGLILSIWLPFNKRIWSPSYSLFSCGCCAFVLAGLSWLIDVKGVKGWTPFFTAFGRNALPIYVLSELLSAVFDYTGLSSGLYGAISSLCPAPAWASLVFALIIVGINYLAALFLYRKQIVLKI